MFGPPLEPEIQREHHFELMHARRFLPTRISLCSFLLPIALASTATLAGSASLPAPANAPADPEPARVSLQTDDQQTLAATYFAPLSTLDKASAVILVHDVGSSREKLLPFAQRLQKSGFAVLALDLRGHGESASAECTWEKLDPEAQSKAWNAMPSDVKAGVDYLCSQPGVMSARVSMLATGAGAGIVARHAVRDERVRELVLVEPKAELFERPIVKDLQQLSGIPTLIVVGKGDASSGKRLIEAVSRNGTDVKSIEVKAAKLESAMILGDKSMHAEVARWMSDKLQPKAGPKN